MKGCDRILAGAQVEGERVLRRKPATDRQRGAAREGAQLAGSWKGWVRALLILTPPYTLMETRFLT